MGVFTPRLTEAGGWALPDPRDAVDASPSTSSRLASSAPPSSSRAHPHPCPSPCEGEGFRAGPRIKSEHDGAGRRRGLLIAAALALALAACGPKGKPGDARTADGGATGPGGRPTPSGLPVPRYVSLKFAKVNARGGPGDDYKLLWVYRARGLPVQVTAETAEWRRVCDPDGSLAWVHKRTLEVRRTVMRTAAADLPLRRRPSEEAPPAAVLVGRAIADLGKCRADGWCKVEAGRASGWVRARDVWGAGAGAQCAASPPSRP